MKRLKSLLVRLMALAMQAKRLAAQPTSWLPHLKRLQKLMVGRWRGPVMGMVAELTGLRSALHLDEAEARLLVFRGKRPVRWYAAPLPAGAFHDGVVADPQTLALVLDRLFTKARAPRNRVLVSAGGLHAVMRAFRLPALKGELLDEALRRELRRETSVPLDDHHTVWQTAKVGEGQVEALTLSVPNVELDSIMRALRSAWVRPSVLEWNPVAVGRAVGVEDAAIVVMETLGFDIVVMRRGTPAVVRAIAYPSRDTPVAQCVEQIAAELSLTLSYAAGQREGEGAQAPKLYLLGRESGAKAVRDSLADAGGQPVEGWPVPTGDFPAWEYAANVGMALRSDGRRSRGKVAPLQTGTPNLIPARWQPRHVPLRQGMYAVALAVAAGAVAMPLAQALEPDVQTTLLRQRLVAAVKVADTARTDFRALKRLEQEAAEVEKQFVAFRDGLAAVEANDVQWPEVSRLVPPAASRVTVEGVVEDAFSLAISGYAPVYTDIVSYARLLQDTHRFPNVAIATLSGGESGTTFTVLATKPEP